MQEPQQSVCITDNHSICVWNINDGDTVCYSLVLIKGLVFSKSCTDDTKKLYISIYNKSCPAIARSIWPMRNLKFKLLTSLIHGVNQLVFKFCDTELNFSVTFSPRNSSLYVIPIYLICQGNDGHFQAPAGVDNSVQNACQRISLGAKLIQCLIAEKLFEAKLGRKTFQLAYDLDDTKPECTVFYSKLRVDQARKMKEGELWEYFGRELMLSPLGSNDCKYMAFISCTRYCPEKLGAIPETHEDVLSMMEAHAALGGGGLALFGSACLHTWPQTVSKVIPQFLDDTKVDKKHFMDDSFYRGTYGGCFATTLGAVCHELGHTFDLGHSNGGIMGRGFDCVNLVFTLETEDCQKDSVSFENKGINQYSYVLLSKTLDVSCSLASPTKRPMETNKRIQLKAKKLESELIQKEKNVILHHEISNYFKSDIPLEDRIFWSKSCGVILAFHRWLNDNHEDKLREDNKEGIKFDPIRKVLTSTSGMRVIELRDSTGFVVQSWEFLEKNGKNIFILPACLLHQTASSIVVEDSTGNILKSPLLM